MEQERITPSPQEQNEIDIEKIISEERERILGILELTDKADEIRAFIKKGINPEKVAFELLKKSRSQGESMPSAMFGMSKDRTSASLELAKKYGIIS